MSCSSTKHHLHQHLAYGSFLHTNWIVCAKSVCNPIKFVDNITAGTSTEVTTKDKTPENETPTPEDDTHEDEILEDETRFS